MKSMDALSALNELFSILGDPAGVGNTISETIRIIAAITFLFAVLQCFLGYKLFKFWIAVWGFFIFGILGLTIGGIAAESSQAGVIIGILTGVLGAFIAFKLYKVGVFLLCGFMGFIMGYIAAESAAIGIVVAIVVGVLGVFFIKPVVIISTSVSNGLVAGSSLARVFNNTDSTVHLVLGILFAVGGIVVQFMTNKKPADTNQKLQQNSNADFPHSVLETAATSQNLYTNMPTQPENDISVTPKCPSCGNLNERADKFCRNCGARIGA